MLAILQVLAVMVVAVATSLSLAHALELPGRMRLDEEMYRAMQRVYYPGFTFGGLAEPAGILLTLLILPLVEWGSAVFGLTFAALVGQAGMQAVYWLVTHPVNRVWLDDEPLSRAGTGFFTLGADRAGTDARTSWTALRDRWEYSHVARAALAAASLLALVVALAAS